MKNKMKTTQQFSRRKWTTGSPQRKINFRTQNFNLHGLWYLNLGLQDGRHRRNHGATAAAPIWSNFLKNGPFPASYLYFHLFNTVDNKQMFYIKVCRWLDSNRGPLVSDVTALPTEPQPLPKRSKFLIFLKCSISVRSILCVSLRFFFFFSSATKCIKRETVSWH